MFIDLMGIFAVLRSQNRYLLTHREHRNIGHIAKSGRKIQREHKRIKSQSVWKTGELVLVEYRWDDYVVTVVSKKYLNDLTYKILGAAIEVHRTLGPGLLENTYHRCLTRELAIRDIHFTSEVQVLLTYKGLELNTPLRCDLLIEDIIVVELKAIEGILPLHEAQLLTYMKLLEKPKGLLINFWCTNLFREGQWTYVNKYFDPLPD